MYNKELLLRVTSSSNACLEIRPMFILATETEICRCMSILLINSQTTEKDSVLFVTALIKGTTKEVGLTRGVLLAAKGFASGDDSEEL